MRGSVATVGELKAKVNSTSGQCPFISDGACPFPLDLTALRTQRTFRET